MTLMTIPSAIAILMVTLAVRTDAQVPHPDTRRIDTLLHSETLAEDVAISIYLPQNYDESDSRYPCLYILEDGLYHRALTGMVDTKSRLGSIPELIVVGIETSDRWRDFTPTRAGVPGRETIPNSGGAAAHREFIARELIPYIDGKFRSYPFRILSAHSLAGLHALGTMLEAPELFGAFIVTSPSLWWNDEVMTQYAQKRLATFPDLDARLFLATGNEDQTIQGPVERFCTALGNAPPGLAWAKANIADSSHQEVPIRSFCEGLDFVYTDWALPTDALNAGIDEVDAHYAMLSNRFGYRIAVPEHVINRLGYMALNAGDPDRAVTLFRRNVSAYPQSSNVHDSLGEAYSVLGKEDLSRASYARAESLTTTAAESGPAGSDAAENTATLCAAEIEKMHTFFKSWYRGDLERTAGNFARFSDSLADEFTLITSGGTVIDHDTLLDLMESEWGSHRDMKMWTDDLQLRCRGGALWIVTYREHAETAARVKTAQITAVLRESVQAGRGLEWVHLHEAEIVN